MSVYMTFTDDVLEKISHHFIRSPLLAQAAFIKSVVSRDKEGTSIWGYDFIEIDDGNCEYITSDILEIKASFVINLIRKICWPREGLIYIRAASSESTDMSYDDKILLRIAYAFNPKSLHAVVYVKESTMESFYLDPDKALEPSMIIFN